MVVRFLRGLVSSIIEFSENTSASDPFSVIDSSVKIIWSAIRQILCTFR